MLSDVWLICESCLWVDGRLREDAAAFLKKLHAEGVSFAILTEESIRTRTDHAAMYIDQGLPFISHDDIYTSVMAAADRIMEMAARHRNAGYIGGKGMLETLRDAGFALDTDKADWLFIGYEREAEMNDFNYALRLLKGGAQLISTDSRPLRETKNGPAVGAGAVVKMLESASGKKAAETGFPSPFMIKGAVNYLGSTMDHAVFVGSDLQREIRCANEAGMTTVYVPGSLDEDLFEESVRPSYVVADLYGLLK
ncbi:MAG: HAD hydrolase-like protein [Solobacterium sp.]|nr:HAD hydrolase-like protein [Solobacterium sp.]